MSPGCSMRCRSGGVSVRPASHRPPGFRSTSSSPRLGSSSSSTSPRKSPTDGGSNPQPGDSNNRPRDTVPGPVLDLGMRTPQRWSVTLPADGGAAVPGTSASPSSNPLPPAYAEVLAAYTRHLESERGLSAHTV